MEINKESVINWLASQSYDWREGFFIGIRGTDEINQEQLPKDEARRAQWYEGFELAGKFWL
jgi:hypothetical protein